MGSYLSYGARRFDTPKPSSIVIWSIVRELFTVSRDLREQLLVCCLAGVTLNVSR